MGNGGNLKYQALSLFVYGEHTAMDKIISIHPNESHILMYLQNDVDIAPVMEIFTSIYKQ